ncbi:hypothetical protein [Variovorax sp. SRS16]|uniref:hypothetical protein n=1 Tax=Variovorax sp. SRS16 TaxID=282217 RepID=UPI0013A575FA|nr:hypothetical protein [Variovorax sp. SRS16]
MKKRGKTPGSGRKALDESGTVVTTVRLTGEQRATFQLLGGVAWLRDYLQQIIEGKR